MGFACINFSPLIHIWDCEEHDPYIEASGVLERVCEQPATNHILFPLSFERWSVVPDTFTRIMCRKVH